MGTSVVPRVYVFEILMVLYRGYISFLAILSNCYNHENFKDTLLERIGKCSVTNK